MWCHKFVTTFMDQLNHQIQHIMNIKVVRNYSVRNILKSKYVFNFNVSCTVHISGSIPSTSKFRMEISLLLQPYEEEYDDMSYLGSLHDTSDSDN